MPRTSAVFHRACASAAPAPWTVASRPSPRVVRPCPCENRSISGLQAGYGAPAATATRRRRLVLTIGDRDPHSNNAAGSRGACCGRGAGPGRLLPRRAPPSPPTVPTRRPWRRAALWPRRPPPPRSCAAASPPSSGRAAARGRLGRRPGDRGDAVRRRRPAPSAPGVEHEALHDGDGPLPDRPCRAVRDPPGRRGGLRRWRRAGRPHPRRGGDPSLTSQGLARLAAQARAAGLTRVQGRLLYDESVFDRKRAISQPGISGGRFAELGRLSASPSRAGAQPTRREARPVADLDPAQARRHGFQEDRARHGPRCAGARAGAGRGRLVLARGAGPLHQHLLDQLLCRDAVKLIAADERGRGTTKGGIAEIKEFSAAAGAPLRAVNGSGLSRTDIATPQAVGALLSPAHQEEEVRDAFLRPRRRRRQRHARTPHARQRRPGATASARPAP